MQLSSGMRPSKIEPNFPQLLTIRIPIFRFIDMLTDFAFCSISPHNRAKRPHPSSTHLPCAQPPALKRPKPGLPHATILQSHSTSEGRPSRSTDGYPLKVAQASPQHVLAPRKRSLLLTRHGRGNKHILHRRAMVSIISLLRPKSLRRSVHRSYSIKSPSVVLYAIHTRSFNMLFPHVSLTQTQKRQVPAIPQ